MHHSRQFLTLTLVLVAPIAIYSQDSDRVLNFTFEKSPIKDATIQGDVKFDQAGPRPPEYPDFSASNRSVKISKTGYLAIPDPGTSSPYDFENGHNITLEAWVKPTPAMNASPRFIVGKGRTGSPRFAADNQNWSLRLVTEKGATHLSFLFATPKKPNDQHWHRWTSKSGFPASTGWHHVAVSYTFGQPDSIRGWIDGVPVEGLWDLGGATTESPIVDDDEVRIGSTYSGLLDSVAVHRTLFSNESARNSFNRIGGPRVIQFAPAVMPDLGLIPKGKVLFQIAEAFPNRERWLYQGEAPPRESLRWLGDEFLIPRLPLHYDDWGIRSPWQAPLLLRLAADVELSAQEYEFLIRLRSQGRLWVDGQEVTSTEAVTYRPPDGEERVTPLAEPPAPKNRVRGYHQQESFGTVVIAEKSNPNHTTDAEGLEKISSTDRVRIVLEVVVGGEGRRTETGEVLVGYRLPSQTSYNLLTPGTHREPTQLDDANLMPILARIDRELGIFDDQRRRSAAKTRDAFWANRHRLAREWIDDRPRTFPDSGLTGSESPIDRFIMDKVDRLLQSRPQPSETGSLFHQSIQPLLEKKCLRCHAEKAQGGLRLDSRTALMRGGESEGPAVVPGRPDDSPLLQRILSDDDEIRMPPDGNTLSPEEIGLVTEWIQTGADWPRQILTQADIPKTQPISDAAFIRRLYLDTVGVLPSATEVHEHLDSESPLHRRGLIHRLLHDERLAHHWVSFWMDILAENPSLLNASLNSTGPFRWFLHDSLRDGKSVDRMVSELILMKGGAAEGGAAGFALAGENDAPYAAKAHILSSALMGIELECARCHDSPFHQTTQKDLYSVAAMLERRTVKVPETSRVPAAFFETTKHRESLIQATLPPEASVRPEWPFAATTGITDSEALNIFVEKPTDTRERLAALITSPQNQRFPRVMVNHLWNRLMGSGLIEPVQDWEGREPSHPKLLDWLSEEFVISGYDFRHVLELIMNSNVYQSEARGQNRGVASRDRLFVAPDRRRMTAEQIVDSLHIAAGQAFDVEELTFVHDGRRPLESRQTLGKPTRAWMFCDLKNERDRPSLSLPKARAIADVLEAFGWQGSRQMPIHQRDMEPNVLQPGILANGILVKRLSRASIDSELSSLAFDTETPQALVDELFLRFLTRYPTQSEAMSFIETLENQFESRRVPESDIIWPSPPERMPLVTWFNHGRPMANTIQLEMEKRANAGPPGHPGLKGSWRDAYEDVIWSLINTSEFIWIP